MVLTEVRDWHGKAISFGTLVQAGKLNTSRVTQTNLDPVLVEESSACSGGGYMFAPTVRP